MTLPALFLAHGSPTNAIEENPWAPKWRNLGAGLADVRAVVCISAHWFTRGTGVTAMTAPKTIHDFGGFGPELFAVQYPAPGDPALAQQVAELLKPTNVVLDTEWGLDHGAWSVLIHLFPKADIPVIQLSIDAMAPHASHLEFGRKLSALRDEGVLILGSGNVVHNLAASAGGWRNAEMPFAHPFDWAVRFDAKVRELVDAGDYQQLAEYQSLGRDAALSIPTPDHYLPLLYVLGARRAGEGVSYPTDGFQAGGLSMLSVQVG